jgi:flagellar hook-length control protein FliK
MMTRAAVTIAPRVAAKAPGAAAGAPGLGEAAATTEVQAAEPTGTVQMGAAVTTGSAPDGRGASARDGRSSGESYASLRSLASTSRSADVPALAGSAQVASAWIARFTEATPSVPADGAPLTTATAQAWGVPNQIVRGLQMQMRNGVGEAVIRLHPEDLGEIVVEMKVEREGVVATLKSDTPAVRAWIAAHRDDLEAGLADSGLRLDDLRVSDREAGQGRQERQAEEDAPKRRPRRATETDARFEIRV